MKVREVSDSFQATWFSFFSHNVSHKSSRNVKISTIESTVNTYHVHVFNTLKALDCFDNWCFSISLNFVSHIVCQNVNGRSLNYHDFCACMSVAKQVESCWSTFKVAKVFTIFDKNPINMLHVT